MREPDQQSQFGRAWQLNRALLPDSPQKTATTATWVVNVPGAHPFWSYWLVTVVSLRDIPGLGPAHKAYPEAEYEFSINSIDPERCPVPNPDETLGFPLLSPPDVIEQFHGISDEDTTRLVEGAIKAILSGLVSPDQDFRAVWKKLIAGTVEHFASGAHVLH